MLAFTGLIENLPESTGMDLLIPFRLALQDGTERNGTERNGTGWHGMAWHSMGYEWDMDGMGYGWDGI